MAQTLPKEGCELNYRLVGFSFPASPGVSKYQVELARGVYDNADSFSKNVVLTFAATGNKVIHTVPFFGCSYTWRAVPLGKAHQSPAWNHFSVGMSMGADTSRVRLTIGRHASTYKDAYLFCDGARAMYDMNGEPLWYLPLKKNADTTMAARDITVSPGGAITYLFGQPSGQKAYEVNFGGQILWEGPDDGRVNHDTSEFYHHEFTRLANGHFMVIGSEYIPGRSLGLDSPSIFYFDSVRQGADVHAAIPFGTLIEYDSLHNVVWTWESRKYFRNSDMVYYKPNHINIGPDPHDNAFYFDEKHHCIYLSFRNISRILKISYPDGKVIGDYGVRFGPASATDDPGLFCGQHSCRTDDSGYLYMLNNNDCSDDALPVVLKLREPVSPAGKPEIVWAYKFIPADTVSQLFRQAKHHRFSQGGSVFELPDHSFLVSVSGMESRVFIVNMQKQITWSANLERKEDGQWRKLDQYRVSIVTDRHVIERMIWESEKISPGNLF